MCAVQVDADVGEGAKNRNCVRKASFVDWSCGSAEWNGLVRDDYEAGDARYIFRIQIRREFRRHLLLPIESGSSTIATDTEGKVCS
jgi:hypothetical protein